MKKILFVEDQPEWKLSALFDWLKFSNVSFQYEIVESVTAARRYLARKNTKVDLVVTDLGLPRFDGERVTNPMMGLELVDNMWHINAEVPVIINSTSYIPNFNEFKEDYDFRKQQLYKVDSLMEMKDWFVEFLTN